MVIWLGAGPSRLSLRQPPSPPTSGARRWWAPPTVLVTVAAPRMTLAWSWGRGNSAAAWRAITVATPRLIWLMACGARGRNGPTLGGRLPRGLSSGALAVFVPPAD